MVKIDPYPRARRASWLWYNTVIFAFCSGRKGKRPLGAGKCNPTAPFAVTPRMPKGTLTNSPDPIVEKSLEKFDSYRV